MVLALIIDKGSRCDRPVFRNVRFVPAVGDVLMIVLYFSKAFVLIDA